MTGWLGFLHAQRAQAVGRTVAAVVAAGSLVPSDIGRARSGHTSPKHGIKSVDRLLGNEAVCERMVEIYGAIARVVLKDWNQPLILVDVTELRTDVCALTASIALDGRGIPIFGVVATKEEVMRAKTLKRFLRGLADILGPECRPVLVTDAGFQSTWFDKVEALGWDYVGRVRHRTRFLVGDEWVGCRQLHEQATTRPTDLGELAFPRCRPRPRRLVLAGRPRLKGRVKRTSRGGKARHATDRRCSKSAREPWLLATSLPAAAKQVVAIYKTRMQIEQNYRDAKNSRWGWHLTQARPRSFKRYEMLLMLSALATAAVLAAGLVSERAGLHRRHQANTVRDRRVLSWFVLGNLVLESGEMAFHLQALRDGLSFLAEHVARRTGPRLGLPAG